MNGFGGNAAIVGYNAGDEGVISFSVPGSHTDDILNIVSTSNVGVPGMWVFRLDSDNLALPPCQEAASGNKQINAMSRFCITLCEFMEILNE